VAWDWLVLADILIDCWNVVRDVVEKELIEDDGYFKVLVLMVLKLMFDD
jgi:hypothetical protein